MKTIKIFNFIGLVLALASLCLVLWLVASFVDINTAAIRTPENYASWNLFVQLSNWLELK